MGVDLQGSERCSEVPLRRRQFDSWVSVSTSLISQNSLYTEILHVAVTCELIWLICPSECQGGFESEYRSSTQSSRARGNRMFGDRERK